VTLVAIAAGADEGLASQLNALPRVRRLRRLGIDDVLLGRLPLFITGPRLPFVKFGKTIVGSTGLITALPPSPPTNSLQI